MTHTIRWSESYSDGITVECAYCDPPLRPADHPRGEYSWVVVMADWGIVRWGWAEDMTSAREAALDALAVVRG